MEGKLLTRQLEDVNKQLHFLVKYELTTDPSGRKHTKARECKLCLVEGRGRGRRDTMYYCISCGLKSSFCDDPNRDYFKQHVAKIKQTTRSTSGLFTEV
jgi:hypothetical protein